MATGPKKAKNRQERCEVEGGGVHQKWQGLPHHCTALAVFWLSWQPSPRARLLARSLLPSRRRPSKPRNSRERPALDDRVRYSGLLAAYLPCGRVSQVAAKEARPPTRASLLAPTCRIDGWMLHRTRSDNGQLGPIYALTCEARVAESMRESWGLMDYSTRAVKDQQTTSAAQVRKPCVVDAVS